jgi:hypothetical protein
MINPVAFKSSYVPEQSPSFKSNPFGVGDEPSSQKPFALTEDKFTLSNEDFTKKLADIFKNPKLENLKKFAKENEEKLAELAKNPEKMMETAKDLAKNPELPNNSNLMVASMVVAADLGLRAGNTDAGIGLAFVIGLYFLQDTLRKVHKTISNEVTAISKINEATTQEERDKALKEKKEARNKTLETALFGNIL